MVNDTTGVVRVKQWYKTITSRDPVTREPVTYDILLDWGIGVADAEEGTIYVVGAPYQLFSSTIHGDPMTDSRVLIYRERMRLSTLEGEAALAAPFDKVHFKHPNI